MRSFVAGLGLCALTLAVGSASQSSPAVAADNSHAGPAADAPRLPYPRSDDPDLRDPGSASYRRYFVYDERYFASVDPTRIHVDRSATAADMRPIVALTDRVGYGRPLMPLDRPLAVRVEPGAPVTFFAPDWGTFRNGERCITVQADERGVAMTTFTFGRMASGHTVVAHSPETLGWVVYRLEALSDEAWTRRQRALEGRES